MIRFDQHPVQGVTCLGRNFPPDPESHQNRNDDDGQCGRSRHGVRFRECQRAKQTTFLPFQGKDRNKGQGDDQQANEQRGSHFHGGVGNHLPAGGVVNLLTRMLMIPLLKPFVRIFNHHNGGIHHRTDGNRYPSQRHDIGVQSLEVHDDKGDTQAKRQRDNRHQGRTYVPQEQSTDDGHHDKLFQKFGTEVINRPVDELAAIVGGHDFNAFRQAGLQRLQFIPHCRDNVARIFTRPQDHHAASDFSLAVQLGNTTPHFGPGLHAGNIPQINRHAVLTCFQDDVIKIINALKITAGTDHILRFGHFNG